MTSTHLNTALTTTLAANAITLSDPSTPLTLTAAQYAADKDALAKIGSPYQLTITDAPASLAATLATDPHVGSVAVSDTASNVNKAMSGLASLSMAAGLPTVSVTVSDGGPLTMTKSQFDALSGMTYAPPASVTVTGAAFSDLASLETEAQAADSLTLSGVEVSDTASAIASKLPNFAGGSLSGALDYVTKITVKDGAPIQLSKANYENAADGLSLISGSFALNVTTQLSVSDLLNLRPLPQNGTLSASISDSASAISANFDVLQSLAKAKTITSITLSAGSTIQLTSPQVKADADALRVMTGSYSVAVTNATAADLSSTLRLPRLANVSLTDTAANLSSSLTSIIAAAKSGHIGTIQVTDGKPLRVTEAQYESLVSVESTGLSFSPKASVIVTGRKVDAPAMSADPNFMIAGVEISDTAARIQAHISDLLNGSSVTNSAVTKITIADRAPLSFSTASNVATSSALLATISGPFTVKVTAPMSVSSAQGLPTLPANGRYAIGLSDALGTIVNNAGTLAPLVNSGALQSVVLSPAPSGAVSVTSAQFKTVASVMALAAGNWTATVSGASASEAVSYLGSSHVTSVTVSDGAANLSGTLGGLSQLANLGQLSALTVIDGAPLDMTETQYRTALTGAGGNPSLMSLLPTNSLIHLTGVKAADVGLLSTTLAPSTGVSFSGVEVADSSANVASVLSALSARRASPGDLTRITLSDANPVTIAPASLAASQAALGLIDGPFTVALSSPVPVTSLSLIAALPTGATLAPVTVSGTSTDIVANLDALQALAQSKQIKNIVTTDAVAPTIALSTAQYRADAQAIALIKNRASVTLTDASASDALQLGNAPGIAHIQVADTAVALSQNFDALAALAKLGKISSLGLTDGAPLTLSKAQYDKASGAGGLLTLLPSNTPVAITGMKAADVAAFSPISNVTVTSLTVADTATNIAANIASLKSAATLSGVTVSDGGIVKLTQSVLHSNAGVLSLASAPFKLAVTGGPFLAADARSILNDATGATVTPLAVSDSGSALVANLSALQGFAASGVVSKVSVTDPATPLALTYAQYAASPDLVKALSGQYRLAVTNVPANAVGALAANPATQSIAIVDSAANILGARKDIQSAVNLNKVIGAGLTDMTVKVTAEQRAWFLALPSFADSSKLTV